MGCLGYNRQNCHPYITGTHTDLETGEVVDRIELDVYGIDEDNVGDIGRIYET